MRPLPALCRVAVVTSLLFSATAAFADEGNDEVILKNGGTVRGTVVSSEPGASVKIIELGSKEVRVIPWAQVSDVERNKFATRPSAPPPPPPQPGYGPPPYPPPGMMVAPPPSPGGAGAIRLHISSPEPVQLHRHAMAYGNVNGYGFVIDEATPVCVSPCDSVVDGSHGEEFSAGGPGITESAHFSLAGLSGNQQIDVDPGSRGLRIGGAWMTIGGGTILLTGASLLVYGSVAQQSIDSTGAITTSSDGGLVAAGGIMVAGGAALLIGGIVAIVKSRTVVSVHPGSRRPRPKT